MSPKVTRYKRKSRAKHHSRMAEDDPEAADAFTYEYQESSPQTSEPVKRVKVPVYIRPTGRLGNESHFGPTADLDEPEAPDLLACQEIPESSNSRTKKRQKDYIEEFMTRIDDILQASLEHYALTTEYCAHCSDGNLAIWKCMSCSTSAPFCRRCMRIAHRHIPLHKIECWTGEYYRRAELWEVGTYMLVNHFVEGGQCTRLKQQMDVLERQEERKDIKEQAHLQLRKNTGRRPPGISPADDSPGSFTFNAECETVDAVPNATMGENNEAVFLQLLDDILADRKGINDLDEILDEDMDGNDEDEVNVADEDIQGFKHYLYREGDDAGTSSGTFRSPAEYDWTDPPSAPATDAFNNAYIRIVDVTGIHHLGLLWCSCNAGAKLPIALVANKLLPTSFQKIRTVFTAGVLDYFRACNLDVKASAYQFYQLLRRLTQPMRPGDVPDLYAELRRMSRLWRWLKRLRWAGYGHNQGNPLTPAAGSLSIFCPACPQPGINLPNNWRTDAQRFVYRRMFVADGNFKADHVRQKSSSDVWLWNGGGMPPNNEEYDEFLKNAIERHTKAPCENKFRAIYNSLLSSKTCDVTGLVGVACARHGCYAPNALVNLYRGEQQKNVDFALLKALETTNIHPDQGIMLIYDIACQYYVHLFDRIGTKLPNGLEVDRAIGLFHIHAHKDQCLFRFSPSFIPGTGVVAGEILESLWSSLNAISPSVRTASLSHRAEVLDDHATDSNLKKTLSMPVTLTARYRSALKNTSHMTSYFRELSLTIDADTIARWEEDVEAAEKNRLVHPSSMDLYGMKTSVSRKSRQGDRPANTGADGLHTGSQDAIEEWLAFALFVEEKQMAVHQKIRTAGSTPVPTLQKQIDRDREDLASYFMTLRHLQGAAKVDDSVLSSSTISSSSSISLQERDIDPEFPESEGEDYTFLREDEDEVLHSENMPLMLAGTGVLAGIEIQIRKQQAEDQLQHLRDLIADRSFQFSHGVQKAPRKGMKTKSRTKANELAKEVTLQARIYTHCRSRLISLGCPEEELRQFKILTKEDLKASTAILKPNLPGSTKLKLSWIWHNKQINAATGWATGVTPSADSDAVTMLEFKRIHWLRARAQKHRWDEELILVGYEMQWTTRYYLKMSNTWSLGAGVPNVTPGAVTFARRQEHNWLSMCRRADKAFLAINPGYKSIFA